jgi:hypothetical protein
VVDQAHQQVRANVADADEAHELQKVCPFIPSFIDVNVLA